MTYERGFGSEYKADSKRILDLRDALRNGKEPLRTGGHNANLRPAIWVVGKKRKCIQSNSQEKAYQGQLLYLLSKR